MSRPRGGERLGGVGIECPDADVQRFTRKRRERCGRVGRETGQVGEAELRAWDCLLYTSDAADE